VRTGILGGAFNPPHLGHLVCAQEAWDRLGLDRVLLMPVGRAPHRELEADPGADVRAWLCELAVQGDDRLGVTRIELERDGPSYTADTLALLRDRTPGDELVLVLGADQAAALPHWERPAEVLERAQLAVVEREGLEHEAVLRNLDGFERADSVASFEMPRLDISSSLVRQRVANDRSIRYLVPEAVNRYIAINELYRPAPARMGSR